MCRIRKLQHSDKHGWLRSGCLATLEGPPPLLLLLYYSYSFSYSYSCSCSCSYSCSYSCSCSYSYPSPSSVGVLPLLLLLLFQQPLQHLHQHFGLILEPYWGHLGDQKLSNTACGVRIVQLAVKKGRSGIPISIQTSVVYVVGLPWEKIQGQRQ